MRETPQASCNPPSRLDTSELDFADVKGKKFGNEVLELERWTHTSVLKVLGSKR